MTTLISGGVMIHSLGGLVGLMGDEYHAVGSLLLAVSMFESLYP